MSRMFPAGSWPLGILREVALARVAPHRDLGPHRVEFCRAEDTGPVACLTAATCLGIFSPRQASLVAQIGLKRLAAADFQNDLAPLRPAPGNRLAEFVSRLLRGLRDLDDGEIDAVVGLLGPRDGSFFTRAVRALKSGDDRRPPIDVIAPILEEYWDRVLRDRVAAALRRFQE